MSGNELSLLFTEHGSITNGFNPLPNDVIADLSKLKAFADDNINVTENLKILLSRIENIVGKGEYAGNQNFLLSPLVFSKALFFKVESRDCVVKSYTNTNQNKCTIFCL